MQSIGVTGATGFIGSSFCNAMEGRPNFSIRRLVRSLSEMPNEFQIGAIGPDTKWKEALRGLDVVVHCAAHVHQMGGGQLLSAYRSVNTEGTLALAKSAARTGIKRFVFVSSVKVMGEISPTNQPLTIADAPQPTDAYGVSKWEAEQGLWRLAQQTGMEIVIVRPPLVYGPGVGANFRQLMSWVAREIPLPVSSILNKRSLVALPNLVDLIETCVVHPAAPGNTFFVSDGQDLSTPELVDALALAMVRSSRRFPLPVSLLNLAASLIGRADTMTRLTQSLQVDIGHTQRILNWAPVCSIAQGMKMTAVDFLNE